MNRWPFETFKYSPMKTKCKAMTLVELICVSAIAAVLITIGVMGMKGVRRFKAERQIHTMAGELSDLRKHAMMTRKHTRMNIRDDSYAIICDEKEKVISYEKDLELVDMHTAQKHRDFAFSPSGRPSNSGTATFRVGKNTFHLIVAPVSGRIRMERANEEN